MSTYSDYCKTKSYPDCGDDCQAMGGTKQKCQAKRGEAGKPYPGSSSNPTTLARVPSSSHNNNSSRKNNSSAPAGKSYTRRAAEGLGAVVGWVTCTAGDLICGAYHGLTRPETPAELKARLAKEKAEKEKAERDAAERQKILDDYKATKSKPTKSKTTKSTIIEEEE